MVAWFRRTCRSLVYIALTGLDSRILHHRIVRYRSGAFARRFYIRSRSCVVPAPSNLQPDTRNGRAAQTLLRALPYGTVVESTELVPVPPCVASVRPWPANCFAMSGLVEELVASLRRASRAVTARGVRQRCRDRKSRSIDPPATDGHLYVARRVAMVHANAP